MATTVQVPTTILDTLSTALTGLLGDHAGDFDLMGLTAAALDAVDAGLPQGWTLHHDGSLTGPAGQPRPDVDAALDDLDLVALASDFDLTGDLVLTSQADPTMECVGTLTSRTGSRWPLTLTTRIAGQTWVVPAERFDAVLVTPADWDGTSEQWESDYQPGRGQGFDIRQA